MEIVISFKSLNNIIVEITFDEIDKLTAFNLLNANQPIANSITFNDTEIGAGYRPTASTLLKLTVRADHWTPNANPNAPHDNGYAVAFQLSQFLDFVELATRKR